MYLTGSIGRAILPYLQAQRVGYLATPRTRSVLQDEWIWAADNSCFGKGWPGEDKWLAWLSSYTEEQISRCLFATLPDVVGDATATIERSLPFMETVRGLGYPVALVTQDGLTPDMVPWNRIDWLFIGGSNAHKLGDEAIVLIAEAQSGGKGVHVGRVNSRRRYRRFASLDCNTCDGTYLAFGPDVNTKRLVQWLDEYEMQPALKWEDA